MIKFITKILRKKNECHCNHRFRFKYLIVCYNNIINIIYKLKKIVSLLSNITI